MLRASLTVALGSLVWLALSGCGEEEEESAGSWSASATGVTSAATSQGPATGGDVSAGTGTSTGPETSATTTNSGTSAPSSTADPTNATTATNATNATNATAATDTSSTATASGSTSAGTTTGGAEELCDPGAGVLENGSLDTIEGDAPAGWEVRTPGQVDACAGSGPHLFAADPAPGCGGAALTIDANGAWDCYAIQTVSPYNSIEGGATYVVRATVRSEGNAVNPAAWFFLGVQWLDENDGFFGDEKNPQPEDAADNDFGWRVVEWEVVAPANARRILLWLTAHYPGSVTYDHVAVIKKG